MIEVRSISKSFPGVLALDSVDLSVRDGEIRALVGENGAGKSTLIKIIAGAYKADSGSMLMDGHEVVWSSPSEARRAGISVIYQEFNLLPDMTVAENVFLAQEPLKYRRVIDQRRILRSASEVMDRLGVCIDPGARVGDLSVADQQMVEIAKALVGQARVLILDEPTAVIAGREVELLFQRLGALKMEGVAILYVSHRLEEVFQIADTVTVLKDGRLVDTVRISSIEPRGLVKMMVGRDIKEIYPSKARSRGKELMRVSNLSVGNRVKNATFSLFSGEILGMAGLVGSGRTELAQGVFGGIATTAGEIKLGDSTYSKTTPRRSIRRGLGFLTEDRRAEGLMPNMSVKANISSATLPEFTKFGFLDFAKERRAAEEEIRKYSIATRGPETNVYTLSGGNQQKVLLSRWVRACGDVLILDEPTRGVDVGAKVEIYRIMRKLADDGLGILMISSELPEIVGMCDRVLVMRQGCINGELSGSAIAEEAIMRLAALSGDESRATCEVGGGEVADRP
jgi:ABC-type sugar transport system ATPase subunit